ncbi:unnamed protein product [Rotaria sp. Silwood1]|nr:unnamed protein product [Rotaria sp. Silwood1]CAF3669359.1 unnamed protein product [Rotaria sp. Silwood1]CAF4632473.1 unnamed protein product [Rotaria sp. Silwood1]
MAGVEPIKAEVVLGWIVFLLIMKNIVLLILLAVLRRRAGVFRAPEDVEQFHGQHCNCQCGPSNYSPSASCSTSEQCAQICYWGYSACIKGYSRGCCGSLPCSWYTGEEVYNEPGTCICKCSGPWSSSSYDRGSAEASLCAKSTCQSACRYLYPSSCGTYINEAYCSNVAVCFSGDSHVQLIDGTSKKIGELQSGDLVYAYDGFKLVSAEMIMMLDRQASTKTIFHTLKTESDHQLSLTSYHLIAIVSSNGKPTYKPAKDLQIHDRLFILSNNQLVSSPIVEIIIDIKTGYYAPFTSVLFVNGILSSCYANVKSHDAAHFYMSSLKWLYYISRFLMINDPFGTSSKDGIHWIPRLMFEFGQRFRPSTLLL